MQKIRVRTNCHRNFNKYNKKLLTNKEMVIEMLEAVVEF